MNDDDVLCLNFVRELQGDSIDFFSFCIVVPAHEEAL